MQYEEAMEYIDQLNTKGIALGLERITALLNLLGNPQDDLQCIHVAGTNGKGSVCAFLDTTLQQAGLRVGRYSSPTLYRYLERFQINGVDMEPQTFAQLLTTVRCACEQMAAENQEMPTVFEVETAVAFLYFKQQQCDYVIVEVGMGGRLDSTNVLKKPLLSVITSISMDHTAMLGNTLAEIATEKAGIIKPGCDVVIAPQEQEAMDVLKAVCNQCEIVPTVVDANNILPGLWSLEEQQFSYGRWNDMHISLVGAYQQMNAAVALEVLQLLQKTEPTLTDNIIEEGLAQTKWSGRFEIIQKDPLFIVDGAHNPAGAQALADTVKQLLHHEALRNNKPKVWLLMGVFADKSYDAIGQCMCEYGDTLIVFQPPGERALPSEQLGEAMKPYYDTIIDAVTPEQAVAYVQANASVRDLIISFGSLSTIKAVQNAVNNKEVPYAEA